MSTLVPIGPAAISATYHGLGRYLLLKAKGIIEGAGFEDVHFQPEFLVGGLKFSLRAYHEPEVSAGAQEIDVSQRYRVNLPIPHFNNKTIEVETAKSTYTVKIDYIGWPEPDDSVSLVAKGDESVLNGPHHHHHSVVLPPISLFLTGGVTISIKTKAVIGADESVTLDRNRKYVEIVDSGIKDGFLTWDIKWATFPTGSANPQLVTVTTDTEDTQIAPNGGPKQHWHAIVIQPYIIHAVVLLEPANPPATTTTTTGVVPVAA